MNKIRELRKQFNYTQTELAEFCNTTTSNVSGWELNKWEPDNKSLIILANIFNTTVDYLIGREEFTTNKLSESTTDIYDNIKLKTTINFSLRLKELREQKGKSQAQLANEIGVSLGCVGMWESTQQVPPAKRLLQLADYFGVTVDYLIGREGFTVREIEHGVGNHPTYLSADEWEWLELRSEIIEKYGEKYLPALSALIKSFTENLPK